MQKGGPRTLTMSTHGLTASSPQLRLGRAGMPSGTVLHVAVESGIPWRRPAAGAADAPADTRGMLDGLAAVLPPTPAFAPVPALGQSPPSQPQPPMPDWRRWQRAIKGDISRDGLTLTVQSSAEFWSAYTPPLPATGQHYVVVDFLQRPCCCAFGFIPAHVSTLPDGSLLGDDRRYPLLISPQAVGNGNEGARQASASSASWPRPMRVGVYLDTRRRMAAMVPHDGPFSASAAIVLHDAPIPAVLAIQSPKHPIEVRFCPELQMPAGWAQILGSRE